MTHRAFVLLTLLAAGCASTDPWAGASYAARPGAVAGVERALSPQRAPEVEDEIQAYLDETRLEYWDEGFRPVQAEGVVTPFIDVLPPLGFWVPTISGTITGDTTLGDDVLDLDQTLGLDESDSGFSSHAHISLGPIALRYTLFFADFTGTSTLQTDITFGGETFTINTTVDSSIEINNLGLMLAFRLIDIGGVSLWAEAGVSYYGMEATVASALINVTLSEDLPVPVVGLVARAEFDRFFFEAEVYGLDVEVSGIDVELLDAQVSVGVKFLYIIVIRGGYRYISFTGSGGDIVADFTLEGFFASVGISF